MPTAIFTLDDLGINEIPLSKSSKVNKRALIQVIKKQQEKFNRPAAGLTSELSRLKHLLLIWHSIVGFEVPPQRHISEYADSVTLIRFCAMVRKQRMEELYVEDFKTYLTTNEVADLLETRTSNRCKKKLAPLSLENFALAENRFHANIRTQIEPIMAKEGFAWKDIEAILPIKDFYHSRFLEGLRPQSYWTRNAFYTPNATYGQMRKAIEQLISSHPSFRTFAVKLENGSFTHVVVTACDLLFDQIIKSYQAFSTAAIEDLMEDISPERFSKIRMAEIFIITNQQTGEISVTFSLNHSVVDAISAIPWFRELDLLLSDPDMGFQPPTSFQPFAELLFTTRNSNLAMNSVEFHIQRLRGISKKTESFWPKAKAPGWMALEKRGPIHWDNRQVFLSEAAAIPRMVHRFRCPFLAVLRQDHKIEQSVIMLTAICLVNVFQTSRDCAVLNVIDSGRRWPFMPQSASDLLPPPSDIDGPTIAWILNIINVSDGETIEELLIRVNNNLKELSEHAHASWSKVLEGLGDEAKSAIDASYRQTFNWDFTLAQYMGIYNEFKVLKTAGRWHWPDR
jgi:hypothetical protein